MLKIGANVIGVFSIFLFNTNERKLRFYLQSLILLIGHVI